MALELDRTGLVATPDEVATYLAEIERNGTLSQHQDRLSAGGGIRRHSQRARRPSATVARIPAPGERKHRERKRSVAGYVIAAVLFVMGVGGALWAGIFRGDHASTISNTEVEPERARVRSVTDAGFSIDVAVRSVDAGALGPGRDLALNATTTVQRVVRRVPRRRTPRTSRTRRPRASKPTAGVQSPKIPPNANVVAPSKPPEVQQPKRWDRFRVTRALSDARSKGLYSGDNSAFDRHVAAARREWRTSSGSTAITTLEEFVRQFRLTRAGVEQKMRRLQRRIERSAMDPKQRRSLQTKLGRVVRMTLTGRYTAASREIERIEGQLGGGAN